MKQLEAKDKEFIKQIFNNQINQALYLLNRYMTIDEAKAYIAEKLPNYKYNSQKSYMDIENVRETPIELNGNITRKSNTGCFIPGDKIFASEKLDGSNASICWNFDNKDLDCFSRTRLLTDYGALNGFVEWVHTKMDKRVKDFLRTCPQYVIFGEWSFREKSNKIKYNPDIAMTWKVFSIWNRSSQRWCRPEFVKKVCEDYGLDFIHELYWGPFISWEHLKQFMHKNTYGDTQEGIVVVNCDKIELENREPAVLKWVNDSFKETMGIKKPKEIDPEKEKARAEAEQLMSNIVTQNRVEKILGKLQTEGDLPKVLEPVMMGEVAKKLCKAVYADCVKEEPEVMEACGEFAGKICGSLTMTIARKLILGE